MRIINRGISFVLMTLFAGLLSANPAFAITVSDVAESIVTTSSNVPGLISGISYALGLLFGVLGILKFKEHVENPGNGSGQTPIRTPIIRFIIGGALFALPTIYAAMVVAINGGEMTDFDPSQFTFAEFISGALGTISGLFGIGMPDINGILATIIEGLENVPGLISGISYALALVLGVAGLLKLMGAWPGADELLLRGPDNPRGHFEHGELHMACVRRLQSAGGDWKSPPRTAPAAAVDAFRRELAGVLETLEPHRPWFVKEPRLCLLVREMLPLLTRPVFIHVVRDPHEVAASLQRRDDMSAASALALWEHYTREAFAGSEGWARVLVDYRELREQPVATASRLFDALLSMGIRGLRMPAEDSIREWIEPSHATTPELDATLSESQLALLNAIENRSILGERLVDA